jgi:hypothetical protein
MGARAGQGSAAARVQSVSRVDSRASQCRSRIRWTCVSGWLKRSLRGHLDVRPRNSTGSARASWCFGCSVGKQPEASQKNRAVAALSPLEDHAEFLLELVAKQPDMTLEEIVAATAKAGIAGSRTAVWRFYERHGITFKKNVIRGGAKACRSGRRPSTLDPRAAHARSWTTGIHRRNLHQQGNGAVARS